MRKCLDCGKPVSGRLNKKFCSTKCRTHYHNTHKSRDLTLCRLVNKILWNNRCVLEKLYDEKPDFVSADKLREEGFQFSFLTGTTQSNDGKLLSCYYDFGLIVKPVPEGYFRIVRV